MKKYVLIVIILGVFAIYSVGIRHQRPVIGKPTSLTKAPSNAAPANTSSSGSNTGSSTTGSSTAGSSTPSPSTSTASTHYKDGTYTGSTADAYYGQVQVSATISGGKISAVKFLQYPNSHSTSVYINQQAMPYLKQEAISSQNANVQIISGATFTSQAFIQSLSNALSKAGA